MKCSNKKRVITHIRVAGQLSGKPWVIGSTQGLPVNLSGNLRLTLVGRPAKNDYIISISIIDFKNIHVCQCSMYFEERMNSHNTGSKYSNNFQSFPLFFSFFFLLPPSLYF
jgi:hypothetical protein